MDVAAYLDRIDYHGPVALDEATLRRLQVAHLRAVPFENLSIRAGELIVLDEELLFDKIVMRRRGGFCYELNGLFAALLRALGFEVAVLAGDVMRRWGDYGPEFDHMTLLVTLADRWLADVGFGDSFVEPLRLDEPGEQVQGAGAYRIDGAGAGGAGDRDRLVLVRRDGAGTWSPQYRFTLRPREFAEFAEMCLYHQTSPQSSFTQDRVCSLVTAEGRITISGMTLITTSDGTRHERELADDHELAEALKQIFGVELPA